MSLSSEKPGVTPRISIDGLNNRASQIQLAKELSPVLGAIFLKIRAAFDTYSNLALPDARTLMYQTHNDGNISFRCGAQLIVTLPFEFITSIHEGTVETIDQIIRSWQFIYSGVDIPPELWGDNPHYPVAETLKEVPNKVETAITGESRGNRRQRMLNKLLPERISASVSDATSPRGVQKLRLPQASKFPTLQIKKREIA